MIPEYSAIEQILYNRGIPKDKQEEWYNAGWNNVYDWCELGYDLMEQACVELIKAIDLEENVCIIVDADADGFTSSAILINYLYSRFENWTLNHLSYVMHEGKQHGFADVMDKILATNPSLVISPDGGR